MKTVEQGSPDSSAGAQESSMEATLGKAKKASAQANSNRPDEMDDCTTTKRVVVFISIHRCLNLYP
jgi:hypothetical protein